MNQYLKRYMKYFFLVSIFALCFFACTDSIPIGAEILDPGDLSVQFNDTIEIDLQTSVGDSSLTFRKLTGDNFSGRTYMVGVLDDPIFGKTESISYFTLSMFFAIPDFPNLPIDSIVMSITLDSLGHYGPRDAIHNLEIFELQETIDLENDSTLYSNLELEIQPTPFYTSSETIALFDSVSVNAYNPDTILRRAPELRIPLDIQTWKNTLSEIQDSITEEALLEKMPGFAIKNTTDQNSMIGLNLFYDGLSSSSFIHVYYQPTDTTKAVYRLPLGKVRHSYINNNYSGSQLEGDLNKLDSEFLYLQSLAGTNIEIDLSEIQKYDDRILNFANLELAVQKESEDYLPITQVFAFYENNDGELTTIQDLTTTSLAVFGGGLQEVSRNGLTYEIYSMNLTSQLNSILDQEIDSDKIILIANAKSERPNRSIILGPANSMFPPKLKILVTNP